MTIESHETVVDVSGFSLIAGATSSVEREARDGDHSTYTLALTPSVGFLAESPLTWSFSGEIEREVVVKALRELARSLEAM